MKNIRVSSAVKITDLGDSKPLDARFVVTNEATGRHFSADLTSVTFLETLRRHGRPESAAATAGIGSVAAGQLLQTFARNGLVAGDGLDAAQPNAKQPLEGKVIALRFDLLNAGGLARRLTWLGRTAFSVPMLLIWAILVLLALAVFLGNFAYFRASVSQIAQGGLSNWIAVSVLFVGIKCIHELGHILAYRVTCLRENLDPGPIRVGLMIFAGTPFPYTDVTGAWRISSRLRRVTIGAAGIYFESFTVALLVLAWASFDLGAIEPVILQVAVFSGALTLLFNLNPAVKLDGYYILTDLLNEPNLAGRASQAARAVVHRALGAKATPYRRFELVYWIVSYLYRWVIFSSVFWLAYRLDPRLATVVFWAAIMLLVVRPVIGTVRPILGKVSPMRIGLTGVIAGLLAILAFVPFKARLLADGQVFAFRTEFLRPAEPAKLVLADDETGRLEFAQPELLLDKTVLQTRLEIVSNMARSGSLSAIETAALESDRNSLIQRIGELDLRIARLAPDFPDGAHLSPLTSDALGEQWLSTGGDTAVAALSIPDDPFLEVTVPQSRLDAGMSDILQVRLVGAPDCTFDAKTKLPWSEAVARDGRITVEVAPMGPLPACATESRNGAAVVARVPLPPRSIAERLRIQVRRLMQQRLPFEQEA